MKTKKQKTDAPKQFDLTVAEQEQLKRIISTLGFFKVALDGLYTQMEVEKMKIEKRIGLKDNEMSLLDMATFKLTVQKKEPSA